MRKAHAANPRTDDTHDLLSEALGSAEAERVTQLMQRTESDTQLASMSPPFSTSPL